MNQGAHLPDDSEVVASWDRAIDCDRPDKRRMTKVTSFTGGTPLYHLFRDYCISRSVKHKRWVLWETIEDEDASSFACTTYAPVAYGPLSIGNRKRAAMTLLRALWELHRETGYDHPHCMDTYEANGLLTDAEIRAILAEVWVECPLLNEAGMTRRND